MAIGQRGLREDLGHRCLLAQPDARAQARHRKLEDLGLPCFELGIAFESRLRVGGLDDVAQLDGQFDEGLHMR